MQDGLDLVLGHAVPERPLKVQLPFVHSTKTGEHDEVQHRARLLGQALVGPYHAPAVFIEDLLKRRVERIRRRERSVDIRLTQHGLAHGQTLVTQRLVHTSSPRRLWQRQILVSVLPAAQGEAIAKPRRPRLGSIRPEDGPCRRRPADARGRPPCRPEWWKGWRGPTAPGSGADPLPRRADAWRTSVGARAAWRCRGGQARSAFAPCAAGRRAGLGGRL